MQLADRLGRDPSHIVPVAGNAKLSFLRRIADALDWDLRDVVESLASVERSAGGVARNSARNAVDERGLGRLSEDPEVDTDAPEDAVGVAGLETLLQRAAAASRTSLIESRRWEAEERGRQPPQRAESFQELDRSALAAHRSGQVDDLLAIIDAMRAVAASPTERAITANREIGAWDLRGRYGQALEAAHAGLAEEGVLPSVQTMLQANLAHVHMTLWHLVEAQAVASDVIQRCDAVDRASTVSEGEGRVARVAGAFARFVRGAALCRAIDHEVAPGRRHLADRARADLVDAIARYDLLARGVGDGHLAAMAHTCHAVILECEAALERMDPRRRGVLERTAARIRAFADAQRASIRDLDIAIPGGRAGHTLAPVRAAGCYAPGGRYPLPSTVLMTAITARAAGVERVWVASPRPGAEVLAAAAIAGADGVLAIGGVQSIGAMALGLCGVPAADIIVGPGNRWVTAAKQLVSGRVGIDMLAGPSELLVIADEAADARVSAADLLAQAEHDSDAVPMLVTTSERIAREVEDELAAQLVTLPTSPVARDALRNGWVCIVADVDEALRVSDMIGPAHLEIHASNADEIAARVTNAGAVFIGARAAEVFGDYGAGPNHTLPTGGTSRFRAGLSVFTFLRARTWMRIDNEEAAAEMKEDAVELARMELLEGHAGAAEARGGRGAAQLLQ